MIVNNVCRLCLSNEELFWVFDQSLVCHGNMKDVIVVTTGVEITKKDIISQKICKKCFQSTVAMYKFRERALKTDEYFQDECKDLFMDCEIPMKALNTQLGGGAIEQKGIVTSTITKSQNRIVSILQTESSLRDNPVIKYITKLIRKKTHQSIASIFAMYADIKLPSACLRLDLDPTVCMEMNAVEEYFCSKNLDMRDAIRTVLKYLRATRRTLTMNDYPSDKDRGKPDTSGVASKSAANKEIEEIIDSQEVSSKRRRLFSSKSIPEAAPTLMYALRLKPTGNSPVFRCTICHAHHTSSRALKKHSQQHFECQYSRISFRILERKEKHLETCVVKRAFNTKLHIELQRFNYPSNEIVGASSTEGTCEDTNIQDKGGVVLEDTDETRSKEYTARGQDVKELFDDERNNLHLPFTSSVASGTQTASPLVAVEPNQSSIYSSTGMSKPAIKKEENTPSDSIHSMSTLVNVPRELLDRSMSVNSKLSVTRATQTELPSNEPIVGERCYLLRRNQNFNSQYWNQNLAQKTQNLNMKLPRVVTSSSNVSLTNIPQNWNVSIGTILPPLTSGNPILPNLFDGASYSGVNSSVKNTEMGPHANDFIDNSLSQKKAVLLDTSVATRGSNDGTAATKPIIRVKNLCDLK